MKKTKEEILTKHVGFNLSGWGLADEVLSAMTEYASQEREGVEQLIEKYLKQYSSFQSISDDKTIVGLKSTMDCYRTFISELSKL